MLKNTKRKKKLQTEGQGNSDSKNKINKNYY